MTARLLALALLVACNGKDDPTASGTTGTPTGTPTGTSTGTFTTPPVGSVSCELDADMPQLVWCTVTLESAGRASVTLSANGVPDRTFASEESGTTVEILAWGLKADTDYTWDVAGTTGSVTTGSLPSALQGATVRVSGTPQGFDAVLMPMNCSGTYLTIIDGDGDIVWYHQTSLYQNGMDAYEWSQADRSLLLGKGGNAEEVHVSGEVLTSWSGYAGDVHHDMARWGQYTYLLHDYTFNNLVVDGVHVYDGTTLVGTFNLEDHYTVEGGGGGGPLGNDWSHGNGINPTEDGLIVLSMRTHDSVLAFDGDPSSPTFLDIVWVADGSGQASLPDADYAASGEGFGDQHNASLVDGFLWLFDNVGANFESRAAKYSLDDTTGGITMEEAWPVGAMCNIEGGAVPLDHGGVLATCATNRDILEFETGSTQSVFTLNAGCGGGGGEAMNRGIPVFIE